MLSTQLAITVIYTYNMFVLFCACDVMNVLSVKKIKIYNKEKKRERTKGLVLSSLMLVIAQLLFLPFVQTCVVRERALSFPLSSIPKWV